jgi:L-iditol 2-dehydrogenase
VRTAAEESIEMKAVVYYAPGDIRIEDRQEPKPGIRNLIVRVHCCAICGTDVKLATVGNPRCHPPRIIGHEMAGEIVHAGSEAVGFATGERVTLATTVTCGNCVYCRLGLENLCSNATPISYDYDGAFAEYLEVPWPAITGGNVIRVPDSVSDDWAALAEPLSCAINAQDLAGVKAGDTVVVVGGGPLGALHAVLAKARNVSQVLIAEQSETRLALLRRIPGVTVIDASRCDCAEAVRERTNGAGADVVIVAAPSRQAHEQSIHLARKGGTISLFASLPKDASEITLDSRVIHYGELRIVGASDSRPEHVRKAIRLMADGAIDLAPLITHRIPLERIQEGLKMMQNRVSLKIVVQIRDASSGPQTSAQSALGGGQHRQ